MIARWVPGGLFPLGTDGFGRSESRANLRRHFEVDGECIAAATLYRLSQKGFIKPATVQEAIEKLGIDPEKINPMRS
jgi:pyruvate dehydrogenase E1 component